MARILFCILVNLINAFSMYSAVFIHIRSAGIYQTSPMCPAALVSTIGESQVAFVITTHEGVFPRNLAVLSLLLSRLEQKKAHS